LVSNSRSGAFIVVFWNPGNFPSGERNPLLHSNSPARSGALRLLAAREQNRFCFIERVMRSQLLSEKSRSGRRRWLQVDEMPFSRAITYKLIEAGLISSVVVTWPPSSPSVEVLRAQGFARADTLQQFELNPELAKEFRGTVIGRCRRARFVNCWNATGRHLASNFRAMRLIPLLPLRSSGSPAATSGC
jgi:hypothetical protein